MGLLRAFLLVLQVATLSNEKSELEAELLPIQSEAASYRARFTEAEKVRVSVGSEVG